MDKCAVFLLAVIACSHLVFSVEGRKIKSVSKLGSKQGNQVDNSAVHKEDHQPAAPSYIPNADAHHSASASGKKEVLSPPTPTKSSDFGDSLAGYSEDFLPAKAGSSPGGVGHSFAEDHEDTEQKSGRISPSNNKHSIAGAKEDSRPSSPGHSPGAGHSLAEDDENTENSFAEDDENTEQKSGSISPSNDKHSIAEVKEDFRPTNPGPSPGAGHAFPGKNSEPND